MLKNLAEEIRSSEVAAKEYQDWVNNPMTQAVYDELVRRSEPILLMKDSIKGEVSLYMLGLLTGWRRAVEAMMRLGDEASVPASNAAMNSEYKEEI